jgi:hypothetical protein
MEAGGGVFGRQEEESGEGQEKQREIGPPAMGREILSYTGKVIVTTPEIVSRKDKKASLVIKSEAKILIKGYPLTVGVGGGGGYPLFYL